jgi:hypothetical protein
MLEEATDELLGREAHHLSGFLPRVFVPESNLALINGGKRRLLVSTRRIYLAKIKTARRGEFQFRKEKDSYILFSRLAVNFQLQWRRLP